MKLEEVLPFLREGKTIKNITENKIYKLGTLHFLDGTRINGGQAIFMWDDKEEKRWMREHYFTEDELFYADWEVFENPVA